VVFVVSVLLCCVGRRKKKVGKKEAGKKKAKAKSPYLKDGNRPVLTLRNF
jgi:hypothetical protein